jgi:hypothetical protein
MVTASDVDSSLSAILLENSEKIQKVSVNVEKDCKQKMFCF